MQDNSMKLNIQNVKHGKMEINFTEDGFKISGSVDMEDPSVILDPIFNNIHEQARDGGFKSITADFTALEFLNSSGIKAIAKWVMKLAMLPPNKKYGIIIIKNDTITWQKTSLPTLTFLVPGSITIK